MPYVYIVNAKLSKPLALWSGPRNVSTALMYSFGNRGDCRIIDEPLFGHFLEVTGVWRPSREEALAVMVKDADRILKDMMDPGEQRFVFSKNMANHMEGLNLEILQRFRNVILTREPLAVLASYRKQIDIPTALDLCYQHQLEIIRYLREQGLPYLVIDSDALRNDPAAGIRRLCHFLDIPFTERMLRWPAGPRKEDGVWAKYWYEHVHRSTGFVPSQPSEYTPAGAMVELYQSSLEAYWEIISLNYE